ncbi:MAG: diaminopimelate epimerase, partial [Dongiaceae bacterium]
GEVGSCGNATRCVAALIMQENGANHITLETRAGILECSEAPDKRIAVDMGIAKLDWRDIPLARACDPNHIPLDYAGFANPSGVSMGNPHAVFFVDDAAKIDVASHGPLLERHPMFPERANISFAQILAPNKIRLRVWERGAGITEACGTAACAAAVAGFRRQLTAREATIILDGGELEISYLKDGHVIMTGPYAASFTGSFNLDNF